MQDFLDNLVCLTSFTFFNGEWTFKNDAPLAIGLSPIDPELNGPSIVQNFFKQGNMTEKLVAFALNYDFTGNATFGCSNSSGFLPPLIKNQIKLDSVFMWNVNYQGIMYDDERINQRNMTTIYAQINTAVPIIILPQNDWDALYAEWTKIAPL